MLFNTDSSIEKAPERELAQKILGNYQVRAQNIRVDFLEKITRDSLAFLAEQGRPQSDGNLDLAMTKSMASVVDEVYETLAPYISEFNKALAYTQLAVSSTSPAVVRETITCDGLRQPTSTVASYRARVSTCRLSIVVRGQNASVDFYLLPVERVMGLSQVESQHPPIMSFTAHKNDRTGLIDWEVEGKPLTSERLERYCLLLFNHLVEETRNELNLS